MKTLEKVQKLLDLIRKLKAENEALKKANEKQSDLIRSITEVTDNALKQ